MSEKKLLPKSEESLQLWTNCTRLVPTFLGERSTPCRCHRAAETSLCHVPDSYRRPSTLSRYRPTFLSPPSPTCIFTYSGPATIDLCDNYTPSLPPHLPTHPPPGTTTNDDLNELWLIQPKGYPHKTVKRSTMKSSVRTDHNLKKCTHCFRLPLCKTGFCHKNIL